MISQKFKLVNFNMIIFKTLVRSFKLNYFQRFTQTCHIHDKYFDYFRNRDNYKNCVVRLNTDYSDNKLTGSSISLIIDKQVVSSEDIFCHLLQRENVMKLSAVQLKDAMYLMANAKIDSNKYEDALKFIDEKCALSVDRWPLDLSLYVLDAWFIILGPKTFRKHYYCALSNLLNRKMKKCSKFNLILVLYFIGMSKKSPPFLMEFILYKMEHFVSDFTDEEWAIACISVFKTSTKMNSDLLLKACTKAAENLMLKNDRFNLISILKCLRLSDYFDRRLMAKLNEYIQNEYKTFNFIECTNFLASFASQNIYNYETYNCLEKQGISQLSKESLTEKFNKETAKIHPSERSRVKDIARFLWAMAFVGHNINTKSIDFMVDGLDARLKSGEFESNLPVLIDSVQSLILFGQYPLGMIEHILNPSAVQKISDLEKAKPKYQLYFINRSAYLEKGIAEIKNSKFFNNIPKILEKDIEQRKGFQDLVSYLKTNLKENTFICCYIMPHIMISGIFVATTTKKENTTNSLITSTLLKYIEDGVISRNIRPLLHEDKVYTCIELFDPSVCIHESTVPLGLMKTKICHLQKLNVDVITLTPEEIHVITKSEQQNNVKLKELIM